MNELLWTGLLAPLWMLIGVAGLARKYPGYSHTHQVMSELGALSRPTASIHPFINNYPIGALFTAFGVALCFEYPNTLYFFAGGTLIAIHGLSHIVTGLFPCDEDLGANLPSTRQKIHNAAGLVMYFSLLVACFLWLLAPDKIPGWFWWFTLVALVVSIAFLLFMIKALKTEHYLGLYQRLSYGPLASWCAVLSLAAR